MKHYVMLFTMFFLFLLCIAIPMEQPAETVDVVITTPTYRASSDTGDADPEGFDAAINDFIDNDQAFAAAFSPIPEYWHANTRQTPGVNMYSNDLHVGAYDGDDNETLNYDDGALRVYGPNSPINSMSVAAATPTPGGYGGFASGYAQYSGGMWVETMIWDLYSELYDGDWFWSLYDIRTTPTPVFWINLDEQEAYLYDQMIHTGPTNTPIPAVDTPTPQPTATPYTPTANPYVFPGYVQASIYYDLNNTLYYANPNGSSIFSGLGIIDHDIGVSNIVLNSDLNYMNSRFSYLEGVVNFEGFGFYQNKHRQTPTPGTTIHSISVYDSAVDIDPTPTPLATIVSGQWYGMNFGEYTGGDKILYFNSGNMRCGYDDPPTPQPTPTPPSALQTQIAVLESQIDAIETALATCCPTDTPTETPTETPSPTPTDTPVPTDTPTITPTPSPTNTPIPDYVVSNAGTTAANGNYYEDGTNDGVAKYTISGGGYYLFRTTGKHWWAINDSIVPDPQNALYSYADPGSTPYIGTYYVDNGSAPAAQVAAGS